MPWRDRGTLRASSGRCWGKERLLDDHQICQGEQRVELCGVLVQAAIAQLLMAEAVLDNVEGMLDHGAHLSERPLHWLRQLPQGFRERLDDAALDRDVPEYIAILKFRPLVRPGVAGIAKDLLLLSVQQRRRLGNIGF